MTLYSTVVVDPPWRYDSPGWLGGTGRHYETLPFEAFIELPIATIASADAHLWMWTTDMHMEEAFALIEEYGFERRAIFPWVKLSPKPLSTVQAEAQTLLGRQVVSYNRDFFKLAYGNGYYGRSVAEFLILATRGSNIVIQEGRHVRKVIHAPIGEHSEKPEQGYTVIRNMSPGPRIDLFGRSSREGFDSWGREAENAIHHGNLAVWSQWAELKFQRKPEQEKLSQLTNGEASQ